MRYNRSYEDESFEWYVAYLDTIKASLPKAVFNFISDPNRHDFSKQSVHDSWVKAVECSCDFETDVTNILLVLKGSDFDREFEFHFQNVSQYKVGQQMSDMYRDLITYEIGLERDFNEDERLVFRAMFAGEENVIEIYSEHIDIEEKIYGE